MKGVTESLFGAIPVVKSAQHRLHAWISSEKQGETLEADKFTSSKSRVQTAQHIKACDISKQGDCILVVSSGLL